MDSEDQEDELLALKEICQDEVLYFEAATYGGSMDGSFFGGRFELLPAGFTCGGSYHVSPALQAPLYVKYEVLVSRGDGRLEKKVGDDLSLSHLPPYRLDFLLPSDYPSARPPTYYLSCEWLTQKQISGLESQLLKVWEENRGNVILYSWNSFLKGESLSWLGIEDVLDLSPLLLQSKIVGSVSNDNPPLSAMTAEALDVEDNGGKAASPTTPTTVKEERILGSVVMFCKERAFGFIRVYKDAKCTSPPVETSKDGRRWKDFYFNQKGVVGGVVKQGDRVEFVVERNVKRGSEKAVMVACPAVLEGATPKVSCGKQHQRIVSPSSSSLVVATTAKVINNNNNTVNNTDYKRMDEEASSEPERVSSQPFQLPLLIRKLKDFHAEREDKLFGHKLFDCDICYETKSGSNCVKFVDCDHVYCKSCMKLYFEVRIKEGLFGSLTCPNDGCDSKALPTQVKDLVEGRLYEKYEEQILSTTIEAMSDVQLCPRTECQCPTVIERERNMGHCPKCEFAFCIYCRLSYHGVDPCSVHAKEKTTLIKDYMAASDKRKEELERRYGKKQLSVMRDAHLSENYLKENAKKCPNCRALIQKSEGCNKMTCNKCDTYFCYLCEARLPRENPYSHFSAQTASCYNQLFEGADVDFDEVEELEFGELQDYLVGP